MDLHQGRSVAVIGGINPLHPLADNAHCWQLNLFRNQLHQIAMKQSYKDSIIRLGREYGSRLPSQPQTMIVTHVDDTTVHFRRRGVFGIFKMDIERFCEIGVA